MKLNLFGKQNVMQYKWHYTKNEQTFNYLVYQEYMPLFLYITHKTIQMVQQLATWFTAMLWNNIHS